MQSQIKRVAAQVTEQQWSDLTGFCRGVIATATFLGQVLAPIVTVYMLIGSR